MELQNKMKDLRRELGLTQKEFATKIGIHLSQIAKYESGVSIPSIPVLVKIARACQTSLDHIVFGVDKKLSKKARINDEELLDLLRRIDKFPKNKREKTKWAIKGIISSDN